MDVLTPKKGLNGPVLLWPKHPSLNGWTSLSPANFLSPLILSCHKKVYCCTFYVIIFCNWSGDTNLVHKEDKQSQQQKSCKHSQRNDPARNRQLLPRHHRIHLSGCLDRRFERLPYNRAFLCVEYPKRHNHIPISYNHLHNNNHHHQNHVLAPTMFAIFAIKCKPFSFNDMSKSTQ